jgi:cytochrome o ubiquinol oxidase subunit IV
MSRPDVQHNHVEHGNGHHHSPKMYIIGFILSILLTVVALELTLNHVMSVSSLIITILVLAALQIVVQLFFFMHITEGEGPKYHVWALMIGLLLTAVFVGGSIWIMSFNSQVQ